MIYATIPSPLVYLIQIVSCCNAMQTNQISGDVIVLASNEENQKKNVREESVKLDEVRILCPTPVCFCCTVNVIH